MRSRIIPLLLVVGMATCVIAGCAGSPKGGERGADTKPAVVAGPNTVTDQPIAEYQKELLDLAFHSATAIPIDPHIIDRSETQEKVVTTCLQLENPRQALECVGKIDNWRRGEVYAAIAFYCQMHGDAEEAQRCLDQAENIANAAGLEDWCRDLIRVRVAKTYILRGQPQKADQLAKGVDPSEQGEALRVKAMISDDKSFDEQMKGIDALLAAKLFDQTRVCMEVCAELFNRFYGDAYRRTVVENKIRSSWNPLTIQIRIDTLIDLYGFAMDHGDSTKALALADEAKAMMDGSSWPSNYQIHHISLMARLAKLRYQAGDKKKARADLDAALAYFHKEEVFKQVLNTDRAEICRMFAEAYEAVEDSAAVMAMYREAVERGVENPNSRPRAQDLAETCRSMALHKTEPDARMWARLRQIFKNLGQPW